MEDKGDMSDEDKAADREKTKVGTLSWFTVRRGDQREDRMQSEYVNK